MECRAIRVDPPSTFADYSAGRLRHSEEEASAGEKERVLNFVAAHLRVRVSPGLCPVSGFFPVQGFAQCQVLPSVRLVAPTQGTHIIFARCQFCAQKAPWL